MKILSPSSTSIETTHFSVTSKSWLSHLRKAYLDASGQKLKKHGVLHRHDKMVRVSATAKGTQLNIDEIVQITRHFFEHKAFDASELGILKKCLSIMEENVRKSKNHWYTIFVNFVVRFFHLMRGEKWITTSTLLNRALQRIETLKKIEELNFLRVLPQKIEAKEKKWHEIKSELFELRKAVEGEKDELFKEIIKTHIIFSLETAKAEQKLLQVKQMMISINVIEALIPLQIDLERTFAEEEERLNGLKKANTLAKKVFYCVMLIKSICEKELTPLWQTHPKLRQYKPYQYCACFEISFAGLFSKLYISQQFFHFASWKEEIKLHIQKYAIQPIRLKDYLSQSRNLSEGERVLFKPIYDLFINETTQHERQEFIERVTKKAQEIGNPHQCLGI